MTKKSYKAPSATNLVRLHVVSSFVLDALSSNPAFLAVNIAYKTVIAYTSFEGIKTGSSMAEIRANETAGNPEAKDNTQDKSWKNNSRSISAVLQALVIGALYSTSSQFMLINAAINVLLNLYSDKGFFTANSNGKTAEPAEAPQSGNNTDGHDVAPATEDGARAEGEQPAAPTPV